MTREDHKTSSDAELHTKNEQGKIKYAESG